MTSRAKILRKLKAEPSILAATLGFTLLTDLHDGWIRDMVFGKEDATLQAHRGSYKTTCVAYALMLLMLLLPNEKIAFVRKTDSDTAEIMAQVAKMLSSDIIAEVSRAIWGVPLEITSTNKGSIDTSLDQDPRGAPQLTGFGIGSSITGKHYDRIFTDDIVNPKDRVSRAERERTKLAYMELQNLKNRGGRIFNTGTPWHIEDCFSIMPPAQAFDCRSTGLMTEEQIAHVKERMTPSLFAANYELRHIPSDDVIFLDPKTGADPHLVEQGECQVDAAYYGEDFTAFSAMNRHGGKLYVYGRMWRKHVQDVEPLIAADYKRLKLGRMYLEKNADKGYSAREFKELGVRVAPYDEKLNKHVKIVTHLKGAWPDIVFVEGTDKEYIDQICDYTEDAEHDDAPDSLASLVQRARVGGGSYTPVGM